MKREQQRDGELQIDTNGSRGVGRSPGEKPVPTGIQNIFSPLDHLFFRSERPTEQADAPLLVQAESGGYAVVGGGEEEEERKKGIKRGTQEEEDAAKGGISGGSSLGQGMKTVKKWRPGRTGSAERAAGAERVGF